MNNEFCLKKSQLRKLWENKIRENTYGFIEKFAKDFSLEDFVEQMENDVGEVDKHHKQEITEFSRKTKNEEIYLAFELSNFYFGLDKETNICFSMKNNFRKKRVESYDELLENIESGTFIDCLIKYNEAELRFQIKGYKGEYQQFTNDAIFEYLKGKVFSHYGDMSGIILAVILQPHISSKIDVDFKKVHSDLVLFSEKITFSEIIFVYNENNQNIVLRRLFPDIIVSKYPIKFQSKKYRILQKTDPYSKSFSMDIDTTSQEEK